MNDGLYYLGYLVHKKNELNRKRRRFLNLTYELGFDRKYNLNGNYVRAGRPAGKHKSYTKKQAMALYEATKLEMKAMTAEMRRARVAVGASLVWGSSGNICAIKSNGAKFDMRAIENFAQCHYAHEILLGPYLSPESTS